MLLLCLPSSWVRLETFLLQALHRPPLNLDRALKWYGLYGSKEETDWYCTKLICSPCEAQIWYQFNLCCLISALMHHQSARAAKTQRVSVYVCVHIDFMLISIFGLYFIADFAVPQRFYAKSGASWTVLTSYRVLVRCQPRLLSGAVLDLQVLSPHRLPHPDGARSGGALQLVNVRSWWHRCSQEDIALPFTIRVTHPLWVSSLEHKRRTRVSAELVASSYLSIM